MSGSMNLTAFRLMLPEDGTHLEVVARARAAGLPFKLEDAELVVKMAKGTNDKPCLGYMIDLPDADDLKRIAERLGMCAKLLQAGEGIVPDKAPDGHQTDREKLVRMRDLFRVCSDAIEALLEASRS